MRAKAWLYSDELFERLSFFGEDVLQEFWQPGYDSSNPPAYKPDWIDEAAYLRPWYPDPNTIPKQPLVVFGYSEDPKHASVPRYVDVHGQYFNSRTDEDAKEAREWWERYGNRREQPLDGLPVYTSDLVSESQPPAPSPTNLAAGSAGPVLQSSEEDNEHREQDSSLDSMIITPHQPADMRVPTPPDVSDRTESNEEDLGKSQ